MFDEDFSHLSFSPISFELIQAIIEANMHDYLQAENTIVTQLKALLTELPNNKVLTAADLEGAIEQSQPAASVQVVFFDDVPVTGDRGQSGRNQLVDQYWLVIVVVRNVRDKAGTAARTVAGPIINECVSALHHFDPGHPLTKFTRVKAPYRATYRNGFLYFPLMFKTRFATTGFNNV